MCEHQRLVFIQVILDWPDLVSIIGYPSSYEALTVLSTLPHHTIIRDGHLFSKLLWTGWTDHYGLYLFLFKATAFHDQTNWSHFKDFNFDTTKMNKFIMKGAKLLWLLDTDWQRKNMSTTCVSFYSVFLCYLSFYVILNHMCVLSRHHVMGVNECHYDTDCITCFLFCIVKYLAWKQMKVDDRVGIWPKKPCRSAQQILSNPGKHGKVGVKLWCFWWSVYLYVIANVCYL